MVGFLMTLKNSPSLPWQQERGQGEGRLSIPDEGIAPLLMSSFTSEMDLHFIPDPGGHSNPPS
jgi:hypothetical protein